MDKTSLTLGWLVGRRIAGQRTKQKTIIGYSYNGVVLPTLPEWDKETYPYAVIGKVSNYPDVYILVLGKKAPTYSSDTGKVTIAMTSTNEPLQIAKCASPYSAWGGVADWAYYSCDFWTDFYWTNTDILNEDGSVYLSASDPIPVYESDEPEKQLIGYSYNGVVLPDINKVWTDELKQQYPYAVILPNNTLLCAKLPYYIYCDGQSVPTGFLFGYDDENLIFVDAVGWLFDADSNSWSSQFMEAMQIIPVLPMWTSHELYIMDTDTEEVTDTLYLATSDPIPVYE